MEIRHTSRQVERVVHGVEGSDGAGVKLTRVLTQDLQRRLDPFLMLDAFGSDDPGDYLAGFPEHPHRGFETVTYMLAGRMRHRDNAGNEGLLTAGGVQWMTAGRGIVHSEMPEQEEGRMEGFQLWLNLPAREKMTEPGYRDIDPDAVPTFTTDEGVHLRVIAGEVLGHAGAVSRPDTEPVFVDVHLPASRRVSLPLPAGHNAFVYVYRGAVRIGAGEETVAAGQMAVLETREGADHVALASAGGSGEPNDANGEDRADGIDGTDGTDGAQVIVVAGRPLNEPIAQYGPFVMNTREELMQAVRDFQSGRFG